MMNSSTTSRTVRANGNAMGLRATPDVFCRRAEDTNVTTLPTSTRSTRGRIFRHSSTERRRATKAARANKIADAKMAKRFTSAYGWDSDSSCSSTDELNDIDLSHFEVEGDYECAINFNPLYQESTPSVYAEITCELVLCENEPLYAEIC